MRDFLFGTFWRKTAFATFSLAFWMVVLGSLTVEYFSRDLPDTSTIWSYSQRPSVTIYDRNGGKLTTRGDAYGFSVSLHELPPQLLQAVIAVEDRRFYHHKGIDFIGIGRAMVTNVKAGSFVQGGSTITQQLARNLFLTQDKTIKRKMQEIMLALQLENRFTKDQILSLYLNRVYFGSGAYGVEAAAERYFDRSAKAVTLYQSALLAGLLKAPSRYSPHNAPDKAHERALVVLRTMKDAGFISEDDVAYALSENKSIAANKDDASVHYFADWIVSEVERKMVSAPADLHVHTTLDPALQHLASRTISNAIARDGKTFGFSQAAIVVLDSTGAVRAMVGGKSYRHSQFNRASQAKRQPGSAFKPIVYLAALQKGLKPWSVVTDAPIRVGSWTPQNYNNKYYGKVSLTDALAKSMNAATVRVAQYAGQGEILSTAKTLGIHSELSDNLSLSLGTSEVSLVELSSAYVPFMNGGFRTGYYGIESLNNAEGHPYFERNTDAQSAKSQRVISYQHVGFMNEMLSAVMERGTGRNARLGGRPAAGKTGTSQSNRDAWFVGYTRDLLAGVWVGNDNAKPMSGKSTGGYVAAIMWAEFMSQATAGQPVRKLAGMEVQVRDIATGSHKKRDPDGKTLGDLIARLIERSDKEMPEETD